MFAKPEIPNKHPCSYLIFDHQSSVSFSFHKLNPGKLDSVVNPLIITLLMKMDQTPVTIYGNNGLYRHSTPH
jgi:hypothetical protein